MVAAIFDLIGEAADLLRSEPARPEELAACVEQELDGEHVELTADFFDRPDELRLVSVMAQVTEKWLVGYGLESRQAVMMSARLPSYFVYRLRREWREKRSSYASLEETLRRGPFDTAAERAEHWDAYRAWLERETDRRMFQEAFGLRQVYVPLLAWY